MADALVHVASAAVAGLPLRDPRVRALLYVGVCLPDILYKSLLYLFGAPTWVCEPTHSPLGLVPWCFAAALLFEERWRARAFGALLGGSWLHLLADLGKDYLGTGVIPWAFPFSMDLVELGLYAPDEMAGMLLPAAAALAAALLISRAFRGGRPSAGSGPAPSSPPPR
jgi:hypothetical protein